MKKLIILTLFFAATLLNAEKVAEENTPATTKEMMERIKDVIPKIENLSTDMNDKLLYTNNLCAQELKFLTAKLEAITTSFQTYIGIMWVLANIFLILGPIFFFFQQKRMQKDLTWWAEKAGSLADKAGKAIDTNLRPKKTFQILFYSVFIFVFFFFNLAFFRT